MDLIEKAAKAAFDASGIAKNLLAAPALREWQWNRERYVSMVKPAIEAVLPDIRKEILESARDVFARIRNDAQDRANDLNVREYYLGVSAGAEECFAAIRSLMEKEE